MSYVELETLARPEHPFHLPCFFKFTEYHTEIQRHRYCSSTGEGFFSRIRIHTKLSRRNKSLHHLLHGFICAIIVNYYVIYGRKRVVYLNGLNLEKFKNHFRLLCHGYVFPLVK